MSASELLKAHEKELKRVKSSSTGTLGAPMLGRGLAPGSDLFFDGSPKFGKRKLNDTERAKVNMNLSQFLSSFQVRSLTDSSYRSYHNFKRKAMIKHCLFAKKKIAKIVAKSKMNIVF